jgi:hypothetical protein
LIILGTSLDARGVPVAGEYEVKNVKPKIMDSFRAGRFFH